MPQAALLVIDLLNDFLGAVFHNFRRVYNEMQSKRIILIAVVFASCSPIRGCVESQFTLSPESRLPKWFSLPVGYSRDDLIVKLSYYAPLLPVDDTTVELSNRKGQILSTITGQKCWHPVTNQNRNQYGGFDSDSSPRYVYVVAKGMTEVIEHGRGPTFRIVDDPKLLKEALESNQCEK